MPARLNVLLFVIASTACGGKSTAAPSTSPSTFSLDGTVIGGSAFTGITTALTGATVSIVNGPNAGRSANTDAAGHFTFTALQQSGFTVIASAAGYASQTRSVTLTSNQTVDFELVQPSASIVLTGRVMDAATSAPIPGATVSINGRSAAMTDAAGNYTLNGLLDAGLTNFTYVSANGYASDYHYIRGTTQNARLYRIERITAGDSKALTVTPTDTLCVNNVQDEPGIGPDYLCRSVRVVAPSDGVITIEADSTVDGAYARMEVETVGVSPCCSERIENPTSLRVASGTEIVINVEMLGSSVTSQSFVIKTSIVTPMNLLQQLHRGQ